MISNVTKKNIQACLLGVGVLMTSMAHADNLKLKVDVRNGQRAFVTNNYLTSTLTVNLNPGPAESGISDSVDVTITNPEPAGGRSATNILVKNVTPNSDGDLVFGYLENFPDQRTQVIYQAIENVPELQPCFANVLAPGESCYIRFESFDGAEPGSQFLQIKGDNTQTIGVNLNVS